MILVDSNIWSLVLRRKQPDDSREKAILIDLIKNNQATLIGLIRLELLSGIYKKEQFELVKAHLSAFPDYPVQTKDYEFAAEITNTCRGKGIQGHPIDFLICAVALHSDLPIYTLDKDFIHYQRVVPIKLYLTG